MTEVLLKLYLKGSDLPCAATACGVAVAAVQLGVSTSGSWKVTLLAVFLVPLGVGEVGTQRSSTWEVAARLGTLNPLRSLASLMLHKRGRICREVVSLNM